MACVQREVRGVSPVQEGVVGSQANLPWARCVLWRVSPFLSYTDFAFACGRVRSSAGTGGGGSRETPEPVPLLLRWKGEVSRDSTGKDGNKEAKAVPAMYDWDDPSAYKMNSDTDRTVLVISSTDTVRTS